MTKRNKFTFLKNTTNIFLILYVCMTFLFSMNQFYKYYIINMNLDRSIDYIFIKKEIKKGGRGSSYLINVSYNQKKYNVSVTEDTYYKIERGEIPDLFYSKKIDLVFSKWGVRQYFRIFVVFISFTIIGLLILVYKIKVFLKISKK